MPSASQSTRTIALTGPTWFSRWTQTFSHLVPAICVMSVTSRSEEHTSELQSPDHLACTTHCRHPPPTVSDIRLQDWPAANWHQYEPLARDHALAGARHAFGEPVNTHYRFDRADVVLSLDADFLSSGPGHLRYVRDL